MSTLRSIWVMLVAVSVLLVLGTLVILGAYLRFPRRFFDWAGRAWCGSVLWAAGTPVRVIGPENVSRDRPQVIACNHQSLFDVCALAVHVPVLYHFVAKKELRGIPLFGHAGAAAGHVFIDRDDRAAAIESLKTAGRLMKHRNSSPVVFPEGTRSVTGDLQPFKKGIFIMAIESGGPIVPTVVEGTRDILPKKGFRIQPHPITVWFGPPIETERYSQETRDALIARTHAEMAEMLAQLRTPEGYGGPKFVTAART